ncbi:MAG TPA: hypothetical protein VIH96_19665 [Paraburkholderia sp.]|jgi:hypothetical protein
MKNTLITIDAVTTVMVAVVQARAHELLPPPPGHPLTASIECKQRHVTHEGWDLQRERPAT